MKHLTTSETTPRPPAAHLLSDGSVDTATLELLESWRIQDATDDPEQLRAAERELTEFKKALNESRTISGEPLLYLKDGILRTDDPCICVPLAELE